MPRLRYSARRFSTALLRTRGQVQDVARLPRRRHVFRAWDQRDICEGVYVAPHGAVAWNDEIELCADALYFELTGRSAEELFPGVRAGSR